MRIAILTQALRYNYGGILQNFALQTVLKRMGHDVVTLDPHRYLYPLWKYPYVVFRHAAARYIKGYNNTQILAEYLKDKETRLLGTNTFQFIDKNIIRKEYKNIYKDVKESDYDAFIVGSDQVWRPQYNRELTRLENMFLDFTRDWNVKRIAYAASFGTDKWEFTEKQTEECKKNIARFDAISVREDSGVYLINEKFGKAAKHVLDPTLLLEFKDYAELINNSHVQGVDGDLYTCILDETEENQKLINDLVKERNLTQYYYHSKILDWKHNHNIKDKIQPPVELWLKGFQQAKFVLTDSFHACVFSILFRKQFFLYGNSERGMSRYISLFKMLGINDRFVMNIKDVETKEPIDYDTVYNNLQNYREFSFKFLETALKV